MLWLGKAVFHDSDERINFFHIGPSDEPPNSARTVLNRVLWKMLADHARHTLRVVTGQIRCINGWKNTSRSVAMKSMILPLRHTSRGGADECRSQVHLLQAYRPTLPGRNGPFLW